MDRARRRELKHAGVLAARQARVDLATTIGVLESSDAGDEGRKLAGQLSFAVGALYGAEVGEPEGVRDRLREASGVLSGVLARLSEPGIPRVLDDAGSSIAKCLAVLYPARAGLERELEASTTSEEEPLSSPVVELPAREGRPSFAAEASSPALAPAPREKKITSPGVAPPSNPMIPIQQLTRPEPEEEPAAEPTLGTRPGRTIPATREHPLRVSARTMISTGVVRGADPTQLRRPGEPGTPVEIRGSDTDESATEPAAEPAPSRDATKISRPPPALLREATPSEASTFVGKRPISEAPEAALPLKRKRRKALELVPDADEGFVDRATGSPLNESERRTDERVSLEADIGLHSATQFFTGLSGDVSHGGIFVATWAPLPLGTEVTVAFVLPGGYQVNAPGRVAWLKDPSAVHGDTDTPGMGVRFTSLSPEDQRAIEGFLARRPAMFHEV